VPDARCGGGGGSAGPFVCETVRCGGGGGGGAPRPPGPLVGRGGGAWFGTGGAGARPVLSSLPGRPPSNGGGGARLCRDLPGGVGGGGGGDCGSDGFSDCDGGGGGAVLETRCGRVDGGGILGGPGGAGSGREPLSGVATGGHGALVRDDGGGVGKPLLAPPEWLAEDGGGTGGRNGGPPTCPACRLGPLLVAAVSLLPLFGGGTGGGGCAVPFTRRPTLPHARSTAVKTQADARVNFINVM